MKIELYKLDKHFKNFILTFTIILVTGVSTGLAFLFETTDMTPAGTIYRYNGSQNELAATDGIDFQVEYAKPYAEMLLTTHSHIISFSLIFFAIGLVFYFNTVINGSWKVFLMIEPLAATFTTFASIWGMRFIDEHFVYLTVVSAILMYSAFFVMTGVLIYELKFKKCQAEAQSVIAVSVEQGVLCSTTE